MKKYNLFITLEKKGVINTREKRIILPEEFYNREGPHNLHWDELDKVRRGAGCNGHIYSAGCGGNFDVFLNGFLQELTEKGLMNKGDLQEGDYFLINRGGIDVSLPSDETGPCGRLTDEVTYYPKVKEDAEEYVKHFWSGALFPVYVSQVVSVPNRPWDISRKG